MDIYDELVQLIIRGFVVFLVCLFLARQPPVGQGLLIHEDSLDHTQRRTTVLWTSDQLVAET